MNRVSIAVILLVLAAAGSAARLVHAQVSSRPVQPSFFGMHFHNATGWDKRSQRTVIPPTPVGSWRIWDAHARWADMQPTRATWRFETLDAIIDLAVQRGIEPLMVLGSTPTWASARPAENCPYGPPGCTAEPADLADWDTYVRTLAIRYKGRIRVWELWNEPKFADFPQNFASAFFTGTTDTMVRMAEIAHRVLKQVDPGNRLLTPGFTGAVTQIDHYLRAGGRDYADGVAVHFYVARPEDILARVQEVRAVMQRHGLGHLPLWNTEQNFELLRVNIEPPGPHGFGVRGPDVQAAYVLRSLILQASYGVERVYWHSWENVFADKGGAPNALGNAYIAVAHWLTGSVVGPCRPLAGRIMACPLHRGPQRGWVVWRTEGSGDFYWPADWTVAGAETVNGVTVELGGGAVKVGALPMLLRAGANRWTATALR